MSFGHPMSRKLRSKSVRYRLGEKDKTPKHWYGKQVGWFGYTIVAVTFGLFSVFSVEARNMLLDGGGELSNQVATAVQGDQASLLDAQGPNAANNIVEVQSLLSNWAKEYSSVQWSIAVKSIEGPMIDGTSQAAVQYEAQAPYKVFLAASLYNQVPVEKQYKTTVKVGRNNVAVATCIERMLKSDDRDCTDALGKLLDKKQAMEFLKKAKITRTSFLTDKRAVQTSAADTALLFAGIKGSILPDKSLKALNKNLDAMNSATKLQVSCPGCTAMGVSDYGVGRLEAAGVVKYSKGSYTFVVHASGGTKDQTMKLSGKLQQFINETTIPSLKPLP